MSVVNFGEVYYTLLKLAGKSDAQEYIKTLQPSLAVVVADQTSMIEAVYLKHAYKIGYADSFAAALAMNRKASLVSGRSSVRETWQSK